MPYKDGCLITAQVLSIPALALSFFGGFWWVMLALGLPAFILFQVTWCCAMNKCGLITGGVLAIVGAGVVVAIGVWIYIIIQAAYDFCESRYGDDDYYQSYYDDCINEEAEGALLLYAILSGIAAVLWFASSILVFSFACCKRYDTAVEALKERQAAAEAGGPSSVPVGNTVTDHQFKEAQPGFVEAVPAAAPAPTETTITNKPDGTVEKRTVVTNPDGSKTVTVTIEK